MKAAPVPITKVNARSPLDVIQPRAVSAASAVTTTARPTFTTIRKRRLSTRSASAPASRAKRKNGKVVAACTRATIAGAGLRVVMSEPAPTSCLQLPTLATRVAVQASAKARRETGTNEEVGGPAPLPPALA